jgi:DNA modification methylase
MSEFQLHCGDALSVLQTLPSESVDTCVTSPPYFGLRDYGTGQWEGGNSECEHKVREDPRIQSSGLGGGKGTVGHSKEGFRELCPRCGARRIDNQIGLERTPDEYVARLVEVFREVRRVLKPQACLWLNLGDTYASNWPCNRRNIVGSGSLENGKRENRPPRMGIGLKDKDLIGIPWTSCLCASVGWLVATQRGDLAQGQSDARERSGSTNESA